MDENQIQTYQPIQLNNIEQGIIRERELRQLVKDVTGINTVFIDMNNIIYYQEDLINNIEKNIDRIDYKIRSGTNDLIHAKKYKENWKQKMCWPLICVVLILIICSIIIITYNNSIGK
jgi:t-SNARE complex subunit (syntaxin)